MGWRRVFEEGPGLTAQRIVKIALVKTYEKAGGLRACAVRLRHGGNFVLREVQDSKMFLDTKDRGICADLYKNRIRERLATAEFQKRLKPGMTVVDIGANIGYYALMEAMAVGSGGKIYAIEPISENVALLKKNVEANDYGNIEVFENAIGERNGEMDIFMSKRSNLSTFCENEGLDMSGKTRAVKVCSLDSFLEGKRKPDFVRMDVEGFEYEILAGMGKVMKSSSNLQLFIEVHADFLGKEKTRRFFEVLRENGFRHCRLMSEQMKSLELAGKFLSKRVLPEIFDFSGSVDELIGNERFHQGLYHIFVKKGQGP